MRREPDYFEQRGDELALLFIAKKLRDALAVEDLLTRAGMEYLVEVDFYVGGLIFRGERAGAFIYVPAALRESAAALLVEHKLRPASAE